VSATGSGKEIEMKRRLVLISLLVGLLALCVALPLLGALKVHVLGTFKGTAVRTQITTSPPTWNVTVSGPAQLGGIVAGTLTFSYNNVGVSPSGDSLVAGTPEGDGTFTAANGDKIFGKFTFLTSPTENPAVLGLVGTARFTGGTGAFTNVTGSAIAYGYGDTSTNQVSLTADGFIDAPSFTLPPPPRRGPSIGSKS
jgi:hypothetical protein